MHRFSWGRSQGHLNSQNLKLLQNWGGGGIDWGDKAGYLVECAATLFVCVGGGLYLIVVNTSLSHFCRSLLLLQGSLRGWELQGTGGGEGCLLTMYCSALYCREIKTKMG